MQKARPMPKVRPLAHTTAEIERLRRSRLMNNSLLAVGLTLGAVVSAGVGLQLGEGRLDLSMLQAALLLIGGTWLLIAYLFGRARRHQIAGGMIVVLTVSALALAIYLLPGISAGSSAIRQPADRAQRAASEPARSVPHHCGNHRSAVWCSIRGDSSCRRPPLGLDLPPPSVDLSINMAVLALIFLAHDRRAAAWRASTTIRAAARARNCPGAGRARPACRRGRA